MEAPGFDRIGEEWVGEGAGPGFVEPAIPGRGFNVFRALRQIFRAAVGRWGGERKGSAAMLGSHAMGLEL